MVQAGQALALLRGRRHVLVDDVRDLAPDVLRHRLVLSYDALSDGVSADDILDRLLGALSSGAAQSGVPADADASTTPRERPMPAPHATLRVPPARQGPGPIPAALVDALALSLARRGAGALPGDRLAPGVGSGTELAQLRPYQLGDDVRQLDAAASARTGVRRTCACRCPSGSSRPGSCSTCRRRWRSAPPTG